MSVLNARRLCSQYTKLFINVVDNPEEISQVLREAVSEWSEWRACVVSEWLVCTHRKMNSYCRRICNTCIPVVSSGKMIDGLKSILARLSADRRCKKKTQQIPVTEILPAEHECEAHPRLAPVPWVLLKLVPSQRMFDRPRISNS